jgi:hypothetical protein
VDPPLLLLLLLLEVPPLLDELLLEELPLEEPPPDEVPDEPTPLGMLVVTFALVPLHAASAPRNAMQTPRCSAFWIPNPCRFITFRR